MTLWLKTTGGLVPVGGNGSYLTVTPWTALTFAGSWVNYGGAYQAGEYRKFGDKVEVRGLVKISSGTILQSVQSTIATLPVGFRPAQDVIMDAVMVEGGGTEEICQVRISSSGVLSFLNVVGVTLTSAGYISLDGFTFSTTAVNALPKYSEVPSPNGGGRADFAAHNATTTVSTIPFAGGSLNESDPIGAFTFDNALGRMYFGSSGYYHVEYSLSWNNAVSSMAAYYQTFLRHNGVPFVEGLRTAGGSYDGLSGGATLRAAFGDYIDLTIVQTAGGSSPIRAESRLVAFKIRD